MKQKNLGLNIKYNSRSKETTHRTTTQKIWNDFSNQKTAEKRFETIITDEVGRNLRSEFDTHLKETILAVNQNDQNASFHLD